MKEGGARGRTILRHHTEAIAAGNDEFGVLAVKLED